MTESTSGGTITLIDNVNQRGAFLVFSTYEPGPSHVGIYVGDGNFIHSSSSGCVKITSLYKAYYVATYIGARRIHNKSY